MKKKQTAGSLIALAMAIVAVALLSTRGTEAPDSTPPPASVPATAQRDQASTHDAAGPAAEGPRQDLQRGDASSAQAPREAEASGRERPTGSAEPRGSESPPAQAPTGVDPETGLTWISRGELPREARDTLEDIARGGPYDFDRDGITFQNREGILPKRARGHYLEFTVKTPGVRSRGARRIVTGKSGEQFYTADHYASFRRIAP